MLFRMSPTEHHLGSLHRVSQGHTRLKDKCTGKHKSCPVISTVILNDAQGKSQVIAHQGTCTQHQALTSHKRKEEIFPGWLKVINDSFPLNFAGDFLLLVTLKPSLMSAGTERAMEEMSQLI